ncbi:MAG: hypothetical protein ACRC68_05085 [Clostridium sp.]
MIKNNYKFSKKEKATISTWLVILVLLLHLGLRYINTNYFGDVKPGGDMFDHEMVSNITESVK